MDLLTVDTLSDAQFIQEFEAARLSRTTWTHRAHIRMAWYYLTRLGSWQTVLPLVRAGINRLNDANGVINGYHETVTVAFLRIIAHRIASGSTMLDWEAFAAAHPDLFNQDAPILLRYYQRETLFSALARQQFVEPDLAALPPA
jgi:hypothetical protein